MAEVYQAEKMELLVNKAAAILTKCLSDFHTEGEIKEVVKQKKCILRKIYKNDDLRRSIKEKFKPRTFNDSIHKTIPLNAIEVAFIQTPEYFRLKNIKQLGAACHVYPGAVHTRFDHSLGVCHLAGEFVKTLRSNYEAAVDQKHISSKVASGQADIASKATSDKEDIFSKPQEMCVRLAGLCHDLGHGPFSHLFDNVKKGILGECLEHERISVLTFKWILIEHLDVLVTFVDVGLEAEHVDMIANMIVPGYTEQDGPPYLYEIVANKTSGLDVDKWDYFARDCHYLGLSNEFDYGRTMELSRIIECDSDSGRHVGFMKKEAQNILGLFRTRGILHQKAYNHKVTKGIELMISDILMEIKAVPIFQVEGEMRSLTEILSLSVRKPANVRNLKGFLSLTDSVLDIIENGNTKCLQDKDHVKHLETAQSLLKRIKHRELYWCDNEVPVESSKENDQTLEEVKSLLEQIKEREHNSIAGHDKSEAQDLLEQIEEGLTSLVEKEHAKISEDLKAKEADLKETYKDQDCIVTGVKISYSSEKRPEPVHEVYFYEEMESPIPKRKKMAHHDVDELLPRMNIPKSYTDYRVRVYRKKAKYSTKEEIHKRSTETCN